MILFDIRQGINLAASYEILIFPGRFTYGEILSNI